MSGKEMRYDVPLYDGSTAHLWLPKRLTKTDAERMSAFLDALIVGVTYPEPPRDSGEADAVHGLTALGTQHDIGTEHEPLGSDQSRP